MSLTLPKSPATKSFLALIATQTRALRLIGSVSLPVLRYAWVMVEDGELRVRLTDLERAVELVTPCTTSADLSPILLPLADLIPAIKGASMLVLEALPQDGLPPRFSIKTDLGQATLNTAPDEGFPVDIFKPLLRRGAASAPSFKAPFLDAATLDFALHAVCIDSTKPTLSSLCMELDAEGKLVLVSTDGFRLAIVTSAKPVVPAQKSQDVQFLFPHRSLPTLKALLAKSADLHITFGDRYEGKLTKTTITEPWALFQVPGVNLWVRGTKGSFPAWRRVLPTVEGLPHAMAFDRKTLLRTVEAASRYADDYNKNVRLIPNGPAMDFIFQHPDRGTCMASMPLLPHPKGGDFGDAAFNWQYIQALAKTALSPTITIHFKDNIGQWLIEASGPKAPVVATYIIMPVRFAKPWEPETPSASTQAQDAPAAAPAPEPHAGPETAPEGASTPQGEASEQTPETPATIVASEAVSGPAEALDAPAAADAHPEPEATPEEASEPQDAVPVPTTPEVLTGTVYRADVAAVQTLGGLESMRDFPVVSWHRYSSPNGDRYKALAWAVPLGLLDRLAITPLTHDQAQDAYLARKDRKAARRERILATVS